MFERSKAEAHYLSACKVLDSNFVLFLAEQIARDFESPFVDAMEFAAKVTDEYIDELFAELPRQ